MKKYIRSSNQSIQRTSFSIEWVVAIPEIIDVNSVAASSHKGFTVPDSIPLSSEKGALINSQALADYHTFIESIENLLTDYYDLHIYYKNSSPDNSFYYGMLAKNNDESLILDFDFRLRVSNHDAHRTTQSQRNKAKQDESLKQLTDNKKLKPLVKHIIVNDDQFDSYYDAYLFVDEEIEKAAEILTRRKN